MAKKKHRWSKGGGQDLCSDCFIVREIVRGVPTYFDAIGQMIHDRYVPLCDPSKKEERNQRMNHAPEEYKLTAVGCHPKLY